MSAQIEQVGTERRARSLNMIKKLVDSRTEMLTLYSQLARLKPFHDDPDVESFLEEFCQSLVDYAANAHFQLYRHFAENNERRQEIFKVADDIYPQIMSSTNRILDFNDKYDCGGATVQLNGLESDLSRLGEQLADRIELEDRLISAFGYTSQSSGEPA